ncbi:hypothetical protein CMI37_20235 [Candidatus Pacearchaeota archaeon]|nr:hypothetical protein [Candidatus Pacearchaeota archaeon]|tara:strand:+ start:6899 stop:7612 length:714 start_codon:yes stop_codon:yes gene_type:complete
MKTIDIIIPIYYNNLNEIEPSIKKQTEFYRNYLKNYEWKIIVGINGLNKNGIVEKAKELSEKYENVEYDYTEEVGRGASLNRLFVKGKSDFVCYMDVDLSTNLEALPIMLKELELGNELVVGSKYIKNASFKRIPIRYVLSKIYNGIFTRFILNADFSDSQCGFKGMRVETAKKVIPLIRDKGWFWDTELLYLTQRAGYRFKEIPVNWVEKGNSGVNLFGIVLDFSKKIISLKYRNL